VSQAVDFTIGNAYLAACNILGYENASEACYALDKPPDSSLPLVDWALTTVPPTDIQSARYTDLQLLPAVNRLVAPVFNLRTSCDAYSECSSPARCLQLTNHQAGFPGKEIYDCRTTCLRRSYWVKFERGMTHRS
jgi:hypothetical protein